MGWTRSYDVEQETRNFMQKRLNIYSVFHFSKMSVFRNTQANIGRRLMVNGESEAV
jgi:hypothetical protein